MAGGDEVPSPVSVYPQGRDSFPDGPTEVVIRDRECELVLVFDGRGGDAGLVELRVVPDAADVLEPRVLRRFAPQADLYVAAARAAMRWDFDEQRGVLEALRIIGRPGRGLTDDFYRQIGKKYAALVSEGEPHPVKALGEIHHVTISAASRWIKEARRRGYVDG